MGDETKALTLRLPVEQHERLRCQSFVLRRPISDLIREAIDRAHFHAAGIWCDECPPVYRATDLRDSPYRART